MINDIFDILRTKFKRINILDVGCHYAHWIQSLGKLLDGFEYVYSVGIDPIDFGVSSNYNIYAQVAIDNVKEPTEKLFFQYNEPGCNSLAQMNIDVVKHTRDEPGWYVEHTIENLVKISQVPVVSLAQLVSMLPIAGQELHYVKIDCQGKDIDVVRSLGTYLKKTYFIQIECAVCAPEHTLYKGQKTLEEDTLVMKELGFHRFRVIDYSLQASPEADAFFLRSGTLEN